MVLLASLLNLSLALGVLAAPAPPASTTAPASTTPPPSPSPAQCMGTVEDVSGVERKADAAFPALLISAALEQLCDSFDLGEPETNLDIAWEEVKAKSNKDKTWPPIDGRVATLKPGAKHENETNADPWTFFYGTDGPYGKACNMGFGSVVCNLRRADPKTAGDGAHGGLAVEMFEIFSPVDEKL